MRDSLQIKLEEMERKNPSLNEYKKYRKVPKRYSTPNNKPSFLRKILGQELVVRTKKKLFKIVSQVKIRQE